MAERVKKKKLNIYSCSANGHWNFKKKKDVVDFLKKNKVVIKHIFVLQETHWKTEQENLIGS